MSESKQTLSLAGFLKILLEQQLVNQSEAGFLAKRYQTVAEVAEVLLSKNITTQEQLAKAAAAVLNIPFVKLTGKEIDLATLQIIPLETSEKYSLVAYEKNGSLIKAAVGRPYLLKSADLVDSGLLQGLNIGDFKFELAATTLSDIAWALQGYRSKLKTGQPSQPQSEGLVTSNLPIISLEKIPLTLAIVSKFPQEISRQYQVIVFEVVSESVLKVGLVDPHDSKAREILDFIEKENHITLERYQISKEDFEKAIKIYDQVAEQPSSEQPSATPVPAAKTPAAPAPVKQAPVTKADRPAKTPDGVPIIYEDEISKVQIASSATISQPGADLEEKNLDKFLGASIKTAEDLAKNIKLGSVPKIVASFIGLGISQEASDIHIEPQKTNLRLRYRVDGDLREYLILPLSLHPPIISRIKILSNMKIDEQRVPQDGRYDAIANGHEIDIRVSSLPTIYGEKIVMRLLDKTASTYKFEDLGFSKFTQEKLAKEISKPWGEILATGPTGSGKSTTLYAIINKILSPKINVITLEDPVEYEIKGINQVQVKPKIGFSFAEGLRSILRQDPNVVMVGEIRDAETASLATHAALTGHLVLSTLHTNNAAGALPRLINMGVEPFLITSAINAIIAQRLVRKLCQKCKEKTTLPEEEMKKIKTIVEKKVKVEWEKIVFYKQGKGCGECHNGFSGRLGIYEVLIMSEAIEKAAIANRPAAEIAEIAEKEGMLTLLEDGIIKVLKGLTTYQEILKVAME